MPNLLLIWLVEVFSLVYWVYIIYEIDVSFLVVLYKGVNKYPFGLWIIFWWLIDFFKEGEWLCFGVLIVFKALVLLLSTDDLFYLFYFLIFVGVLS